MIRIMLLALALVLPGLCAAARTPSVPIMPVSEIVPGMEGYGLTVMQGGEPEKMPVRILGVLRKGNSGGDLILARLVGEKFEHSGVAAGMSGSPIYIDGKLVGALAYAWSFSKDPVCGITPIEDMLGTYDADAALDKALHKAAAPGALPDDMLSALARGDAPQATFAPVNVDHPATGPGQLLPVATPVTVSGFSERGRQFLQGVLEQSLHAPVAVTGGGGDAIDDVPGATELQPGSVLSITLMSGDMEAAAIGTVTYRDGDTLLGFGHPMFNWGQVCLPMGGGVIHHVMAGAMSSFKMGDPTDILGTLVHDGQFAVMARLDRKEAPLLPVKLTVREHATGREKIVNVKVFNDKELLSSLLYTALYNGVSQLTGDMGEASAHVRLEVTLKEWPEPLVFEDMYYSSDLFFIGALERVSALVSNPFQDVTVESLSVFMDIERNRPVARITSASLQQDRVYPGDTVLVNVEIEPYGAPAQILRVPVTIPAAAAPGAYKLVAMSGMERGPLSDVMPETFPQFVRYVQNFATNNSLVMLTIYPEKAPAVRGEELMEMPASLRDTMIMAPSYSGVMAIDKQDRKVVPTDLILTGNALVPVFVEKRKSH